MATNVLPKYFGRHHRRKRCRRRPMRPMPSTRPTWQAVRDQGQRRSSTRPGVEGKRIIVLAGRPYHVDPEVNHGIDKLITRHGAAVVTEDSISQPGGEIPHQRPEPVDLSQPPVCSGQVLHHPAGHGSGAAGFASAAAWTPSPPTRPARSCRSGGKLYTQLKIDEITNLGAVNIRLRSLFAALDERE